MALLANRGKRCGLRSRSELGLYSDMHAFARGIMPHKPGLQHLPETRPGRLDLRQDLLETRPERPRGLQHRLPDSKQREASMQPVDPTGLHEWALPDQCL
jgi:hypothetical protein